MYKKLTTSLSHCVVSALLLSSVSFGFARFDEGMFTPDQIATLNLKKKGLNKARGDI